MEGDFDPLARFLGETLRYGLPIALGYKVIVLGFTQITTIFLKSIADYFRCR